MELKNILSFEITRNERVYRFSVPAGAPYGETYDAIFTFLQNIIDHQKKNLETIKEQNKGE